VEQFSGPIEARSQQRERFRELYWHPEITYEEDPRWPGSGTYRGKDAVAESSRAIWRSSAPARSRSRSWSTRVIGSWL
jgi:hypothetical protein